MDISDLVHLLVALVGGGGVATVVTVLVGRKKVGAEARSVEVKAELQVVGVARALLSDMRDELARVNNRLKVLEGEYKHLLEKYREQQVELLSLNNENERLELENEELRNRVLKLEHQLPRGV